MPGRLEHAAADAERAPRGRACGGSKSLAAAARACQVDSVVLSIARSSAKVSDGVDLALETARWRASPFLAMHGPMKTIFGPRREAPATARGRGDHRRDDRRQRVDQVGMVRSTYATMAGQVVAM